MGILTLNVAARALFERTMEIEHTLKVTHIHAEKGAAGRGGVCERKRKNERKQEYTQGRREGGTEGGREEGRDL